MNKLLFFILCVLSKFTFANTPFFSDKGYEEKFYIEPRNVHIEENGIFLVQEENLIPIKAVSFDEAGFYAIFYSPLILEELLQTRSRWKCPYCNYWWNIGERCKNPKCATNQW